MSSSSSSKDECFISFDEIREHLITSNIGIKPETIKKIGLIIEQRDKFFEGINRLDMLDIGLTDDNFIYLYDKVFGLIFSSKNIKIRNFVIGYYGKKTNIQILNFFTFLFGKKDINIEGITITNKNFMENNTFDYLLFYIKNDDNIKEVDFSSKNMNDEHIEKMYAYFSSENCKIKPPHAVEKIFDAIKMYQSTSINVDEDSLASELYKKGEHDKIYNGHIKNLDISGNTKITNKSIPILKKLCEEFQMNLKNIYGTSIKNENGNLNFLIDSLFKNEINGSVIYSDYNFGDENMECMSKYANTSNFNKVKRINFYNNKITSKGINLLFEELILNEENQLKDIELSDNNLDDNCIEPLGRLIQKKKSIECISLSGNYITDKGIDILSYCIIGNTKIRLLDIRNNIGITDGSFDILKEMIEKSNIEFIDLEFTSINPENILLLKNSAKIPIENREIPLITIGNVKSASKNQ